MARHESWRRVDEVRALILAAIIKKEYLEGLLENSQSKNDQTLKRKQRRKLNRNS